MKSNEADPRSYERNFSECVEKPLYEIAKIAFITARIITSLDFISAVQYMIHSCIISFIHSFVHSSREHLNPQMTGNDQAPVVQTMDCAVH